MIFYISLILFTAMQSIFTKRSGKSGENNQCFQLTKALSALIVFGAVILIKGSNFNLKTILYGMASGIVLSCSNYMGYRALKLGPMGLTSAVAAFSLIIPIIYGVAFLNEVLTYKSFIAFALIAAAILLINKVGSERSNLSLAWWIFIISTLFFNGISSVIQKQHQVEFPGQMRIEFMTVSMAVCTMIFLISYCIHIPKRQNKGNYKILNGTVSGISNGIAGFLTLYLSSTQRASVMFSVISVCTVIAALLSGRIIFKEHISFKQMIGVACGTVAVILLK